MLRTISVSALFYVTFSFSRFSDFALRHAQRKICYVPPVAAVKNMLHCSAVLGTPQKYVTFSPRKISELVTLCYVFCQKTNRGCNIRFVAFENYVTPPPTPRFFFHDRGFT